LLLILLAGTLAVAFVLLAPRGPSTETFVEIASGTSSRQVAAQLESQRLIWSRYAFDVLRLVKGGTLKAGEYRFDHPAKLSEVYGRLLRGDVYTRSLTIPEGSNIFDIANRVEAAQLGRKEAFLEAAHQQAGLIADLDPKATSLEGYLFPDTYHFQRLTKPEQIVQAMVKRFRVASGSLGLNGDDHRVVTLASLIERETPIAEERPLVASVFENRLAKGMALMTDPTVIYAALIDGRYRGTIFQSDLAAESPYNTYKHVGLPPGPICNPGQASLKAAMAPAHTDYLYFVAATADPSGHSRFAKTLEEHAQNVQAYRRSIQRNREQ
jgi:peptidoglycan lytic transglycosylase G